MKVEQEVKQLKNEIKQLKESINRMKSPAIKSRISEDPKDKALYEKMAIVLEQEQLKESMSREHLLSDIAELEKVITYYWEFEESHDYAGAMNITLRLKASQLEEGLGNGFPDATVYLNGEELEFEDNLLIIFPFIKEKIDELDLKINAFYASLKSDKKRSELWQEYKYRR